MDVPVYTNPEDALAWAIDQPDSLSRDAAETLLSRVGRESAPRLLADLFFGGLLTREALHLVGVVWSMDEYPDRSLDRETWRAMFDEAGYLINGEPGERPREELRLYRGAVAERRDDWSWTESLTVAEKYAAGGWRGRPESAVWTAMVPPEALLCRNTTRDEDEYVVDTDKVGGEVTRYPPIRRP